MAEKRGKKTKRKDKEASLVTLLSIISLSIDWLSPYQFMENWQNVLLLTGL